MPQGHTRLAHCHTRGNMVLDPFGGAGTCAVACAKLGRRFIHIDNSPLSIECVLARLRPFYGKDGFRVSIVSWTRAGERELFKRGLGHLSDAPPMLGERTDRESALRGARLRWDDGRNWVLLGDSLKWMSVIPDGVVDLIYADPPFATGKDFGVYDDRWDETRPMTEDLHLPDAKSQKAVYSRIKRLTPVDVWGLGN